MQLRRPHQQDIDQHHRNDHLRQCRSHGGTQNPQTEARQRHPQHPQRSAGEDEEGVEHHVQQAHHHHADAGGFHVARRTQQSAAEVIQLHEGQRQNIYQKVGAGILPDGGVCPQPARQIPGDAQRYGHHHKAEGHAHQKGQLHDAAGFLRLSGSQRLRHRHVKADGQRNAQIAEEPRGGRHHTDSGGGIGAQLAHHGRVNILHHHGGDLGQNGRPTQLSDQQQQLPCRDGLSAL